MLRGLRIETHAVTGVVGGALHDILPCVGGGEKVKGMLWNFDGSVAAGAKSGTALQLQSAGPGETQNDERVEGCVVRGLRY